MTKYNAKTARPAPKGPVTVETASSVKTHEGGTGYLRDAKGELFLRGTGSFAGEDSFYENKFVRDDRVRELVRGLAVSADGFAWLSGFLPWLRKDGYMRSGPILMAAEAVHARLAAGLHGGSRQLIASVLSRGDEPGEMLGYWHQRFGRSEPKPVKRGIADAMSRIANEFTFLKYGDKESAAFRYGAILERVHGKPKDAWQGDLYRHAVDHQHGHFNEVPETLPMVRNQAQLTAAALDDAEALLDADALRESGMTWEKVSSLAGSKVSKKDMWEAKIPSMGIFALLRNLRNFDQAGISEEAAAQVIAKLTDPKVVGKSGIFPYQVYTAWTEVKSLRWGPALETMLTLSTQNIPELPGRTLILIDTSASMSGGRMSGKSVMSPAQAAALFGLAQARKSNADVYGFADGQFRVANIGHSASVLRETESFCRCIGNVGHGTRIELAVRATYDKHDRVMIFTDMQTFANQQSLYGVGDVASAVPQNVPVYGFNLVGYTPSAMAGGSNRHELGSLSDASFRLIPMLEAAQNAAWPWELEAAGAAAGRDVA